MIACSMYNAKVYYGTYNTSSRVYCETDGWQEISSEAFVCNETKIKETAQEQDEPNTGREAPVYWERPHRRLATVTALRDLPRQLKSSFG